MTCQIGVVGNGNGEDKLGVAGDGEKIDARGMIPPPSAPIPDQDECDPGEGAPVDLVAAPVFARHPKLCFAQSFEFARVVAQEILLGAAHYQDAYDGGPPSAIAKLLPPVFSSNTAIYSTIYPATFMPQWGLGPRSEHVLARCDSNWTSIVD